MTDTLIVVASEREGVALVEQLGLRYLPGFELCAGEHEKALGLYRGDACDLLISGVLEHHMTAATARHICAYGPKRVINFGACGTYANCFAGEAAPEIEDVVCISTSMRFDVDDNLHWVPARELAVADIGLGAARCVTGSRYSRPDDHESDYFPRSGQVEDMELYALAVLCETFAVPLYSLKYVTNEVGPHGREQFRKHVITARDAAIEPLRGSWTGCREWR